MFILYLQKTHFYLFKNYSVPLTNLYLSTLQKWNLTARIFGVDETVCSL